LPIFKNIIAVVFDFDDTLMPDTTSLFLEAHNINSGEFWQKEVGGLVKKGYDPTLAFLQKFLSKIGSNKSLGQLSNSDLNKFGKTLNSKFFTGVKSLPKDLRKIASKYENVEIEFYIISGGLFEIINGCKFVQDNFDGVYGCELGEDERGILRYIKRAITFTEKTRYLFEINKGIKKANTTQKPFLVNKDIKKENRRIPLKNFIYVGDGLTDIPCFSLLKNKGDPFGVFNPKSSSSAKQALLEFLKTERVIACYAPEYKKTDQLGSLIRVAVAAKCGSLYVDMAEVL
jgi:phosphoserine phosphatase